MRTDSNRQADEIRRGMALHDADVARQKLRNGFGFIVIALICLLVAGAFGAAFGFGVGLIAAGVTFLAFLVQARYYRRR